MTNDLLLRIDAVRKELESLPNGITIGELPRGTRIESTLLDKLPTYRDFIQITDGARLGVVDFYFYSDVPKHQAAAAVLPGGEKRWLCIGHILYDPLFLEMPAGSLYLMNSDVGPDSLRELGSLDDFLLALFDHRYLQTTGADSDRWFALLQRLHYAE